MQTKKIFSSLTMLGMRLTLLVTMLVALLGNASTVSAGSPLSLGSVTVGSQSGILTSGTAGSVTFSVTVTRSGFTPGSFNLSVSGLPSGMSGAFSVSNPVSFSGSSRTVTLTLSTSNTTPAGTSNFTVTAQSGFTSRAGTGSVTIGSALLTPTITFGSAPSPTFPGGNFTVSATTNSNGALTYGVVSGPCALVSGNTFSPSGVGTCIVQANTAATSTYAAGSAQQVVTIMAGGPGTSFDLCATTGSASMPGGVNVPIWGYVLGDCSGGPVSSLPGPTLIVNQGDPITVTLHNNLGESTSLLFQGQSIRPDLTGAAPGGTRSYTFTALNAGTFLYEAGLLANAQHQVAMGMYGALIVRPATAGQAYNSATTAYDLESVMVLSELDTALNNSASPAAFDMRNYKPKYFLINGKAFPSTDAVTVAAGNRLLLRYVNAGLQAHAMSTLGLSQTILAQDGSPYNFSHNVVAETIATGETLDALVTIPASVPADSKFALYDANMLLRNNSGTGSANSGFGGMLAFLVTASSGSGPDTVGPLSNSLALSPNPSDGLADVTVSASVSDVTTGGANIAAAEFYIDSTQGSPTAMTGAFASPTEFGEWHDHHLGARCSGLWQSYDFRTWSGFKWQLGRVQFDNFQPRQGRAVNFSHDSFCQSE